MNVAQSGTLLFRRMAFGNAIIFSDARRFPIGDTAGYQPALHRQGGAR
jgi:hypothetical protein